MTHFAIAAILSLAIAALSYVLRSLTLSGAVAAFIIGIAVFGVGGWPGAAVLLTFFVSASLLSRMGRVRKRELRDIEKQGPRDAWQVLANGGVAAVCIALSSLSVGSPPGAAPLQAAFAGALAAATADTWSTEIGTLTRGKARSILTFRPVATGLSGGISLAGTIAQLAGAALLAGVAYAAHLAPFWPVAIGGVVGSFADSILGATAQALRWCPTCNAQCETNPHHCGTPTTLRRGFGWIENDVVNFLCTLTGAVVALLASTH